MLPYPKRVDDRDPKSVIGFSVNGEVLRITVRLYMPAYFGEKLRQMRPFNGPKDMRFSTCIDYFGAMNGFPMGIIKE